MKAQGQHFNGTVATLFLRTRPVSSRRSAVATTVGASLAAVILSTSALMFMARPILATPTTLAFSSTSATSTSASSAMAAVATTTVPIVHTASLHAAQTSSSPSSSSATTPSRSSTLALRSALASTPSSTPSVALRLAANIAPVPDFQVSGSGPDVGGVTGYQNPCVTIQSTWSAPTNDPACTNYVLTAIDHARDVEGLAPMVLPSNWYLLTTAQQLFVVANLERTARGLPAYLGLNAALSAAAQDAARTNADSSIAAGFPVADNSQGSPAFGGARSGGYSVLAADYNWMYADGWAGGAAANSNTACTSADAPGCWDHRAELLGSDPGYNPGVGLNCASCEMGTGFAMVNGGDSYVVLIEAPRGSLPPMTFTWARDVFPYLG